MKVKSSALLIEAGKPTMKPTSVTIAAWLVTITLTFATPIAHSAQPPISKTFSVGIVPQFDSRKIHKIWRPLLNELETITGHKFKLEGAPTIQEFENELNAGRFDFAYINPYQASLTNNKQGYIPLVRDIEKHLQGILVVRRGKEIKRVEELANQIVSFPAPNALGATLMIRADMQDLFDTQVKPQYVKTHSSVYLNVALGLTKAGGGVQKTLNQQSVEIRDALRVLYKTRHVVPHPLSAHPRVNSGIIAQVTEGLLALNETVQGQQMLKKIPINKIGPATIEDYAPLGRMGLERFYEN